MYVNRFSTRHWLICNQTIYKYNKYYTLLIFQLNLNISVCHYPLLSIRCKVLFQRNIIWLRPTFSYLCIKKMKNIQDRYCYIPFIISIKYFCLINNLVFCWWKGISPEEIKYNTLRLLWHILCQVIREYVWDIYYMNQW